MTVTSYPRTAGSADDNPRSLVKWLFPVRARIAIVTMCAVGLIFALFNLARIIWLQPGDIVSAIIALIVASLTTLFFIWILYRILIIVKDGDASKSIILLTLPTIMLAIGDAYFNSLIMDRVGLAAGRMATFDLLFIHYLILAGWGGLYLALAQGETTRIAVAKSEKMELLTRESELRALRFQLNPHFVFNALNSVSSLVIDEQNQRAERLVDGLADYMRVVLKDDGKNIITVKEEIEQQVRYLEIEQVRFPDRLKFETHIEADVEEWKIPALIVQPLIENAIKYGVAQATEPVRIIISAIAEAGRLKLSVSNDGYMAPGGQAPDADGPEGTGTGLANVKDRLNAVYGPSAALTTANSRDGMAVARMVIPDESHIFVGIDQ